MSFYHRCMCCGCLFDVRRKGDDERGRIEGKTDRLVYYCPWCGANHTTRDGCEKYGRPWKVRA